MDIDMINPPFRFSFLFFPLHFFSGSSTNKYGYLTYSQWCRIVFPWESVLLIWLVRLNRSSSPVVLPAGPFHKSEKLPFFGNDQGVGAILPFKCPPCLRTRWPLLVDPKGMGHFLQAGGDEAKEGNWDWPIFIFFYFFEQKIIYLYRHILIRCTCTGMKT